MSAGYVRRQRVPVPGEYRALSVRQPWAEHIASGRKTIECRTWRVDYRGPIVIVASARAPGAFGPQPARWPCGVQLGCAVCLVDLVDVRPGGKGDDKHALCPTWGAYAWILRNPCRLVPHAVKGRVSLYHVAPELVQLASA